MQWLTQIVDEVERRRPSGDILISSGGSPSGTYHLGHLRELIIADAVMLELRRRGRKAKHIYFSDDLDGLRKIPPNVPQTYEKYLGKSLCDIPAPDSKKDSYGEQFLSGLEGAAKELGLDIEFVRSHKKYRNGFFVVAIEKSLEHLETIRKILETISGHKLGEDWSPIQINEDGYLKKRQFIGIDTGTKTLRYMDKDKKERNISYAKGDVKLDWRIDWPARWWLLGVHVEPFGRDHATKGGSYDTGSALVEQVFDSPAPLPVPYDFVNLTGDTKKMSASRGSGLDALTVVKVLPPEVVRYFMLRSAPSKRLYFDPENGVSLLIDEYAELLDTKQDSELISLVRNNLKPIVSNIPFSHLVASYQAALKDTQKTLDILSRTGYQKVVSQSKTILQEELGYINGWLEHWAPEDVKFELLDDAGKIKLSTGEQTFANTLAGKIEKAPKDADGEWFHQAIYESKGEMQPKDAFKTVYQLLIGKDSGPRAGWFLSILDKDWLVQRLRFEA